MAGPPRLIPPPLRTLEPPMDAMPDRMVEARYARKPNHKNAVAAWASRQRFSRLPLPLVMLLNRV